MTEEKRFTKAIKPVIERLALEFNHTEDAEFSLDSIAFQEWQAGIHPTHIEEDLTYVATIAKRYDDPVAVLKKFDKAIPIYLKRKSEKRVSVGSFAQLNGCEARLAGGGNKLNLGGLDGRIHAYLIGDGRS